MKYRIRPFGIPAYKRCKRRVAKKHLNRRRNMYWRYAQFHDQVGDVIINDCSGLNVKPDEVSPEYRKIGKGRHAKAEILFDLEFSGTNCGCTFYHCGVTPAITMEQSKQRIQEVIDYFENRDDPWNFVERYENIVLVEDGTYTYTDAYLEKQKREARETWARAAEKSEER